MIFLYIVYKKIWPLLEVQTKNYQNKIKQALDELSQNHSELLEILSLVKKESEILPDKVRSILQNGQEKAEKLKESYNQSMTQLMIERQELAQKSMMKMQNKLEDEFYFVITKEMQHLLRSWAKEQASNPLYHLDSFKQSYSLLENRLQK